MKFFKRSLSLLLALLSLVSVGVISFSAVQDGYSVGDVIFFDYSAVPEWHGGGFGMPETNLYINFTANTRYDSGEKEKVIIGQDPDRFSPRKVTQEVKDYVYKYTVTAEDAGASTLRFWRGDNTNLWNHSVELKFSDFAAGKNTVYLTGWNQDAEGIGYVDTCEFYDYDIKPIITITPEDGEKGDEFTVKLSYEKAIDADVSYSYEIYVGGILYAESDTYSFIPELNFTEVKGVITAKYADGRIAAKGTATDTVAIGEYAYMAAQPNNLYAHAVSGSAKETEAWSKAQQVGNEKIMFLPSSADKSEVELLNAYNYPITINGVEIPAGETAVVAYDTASAYEVTGADEYNLKFMRSDSEASLYVNNDYSTTDNLWDYLCEDKENSTSAYAVIVDAEGNITDTDIKKIKGRGNTTWAADKKPFNLNFNSAVSVGTMQSTKKYSLLANFQDSALSRNRILYDLGDAVGLRYSSDSRFVDFYIDGEYMGQYQMCQKIDPGSDNLIYDVDEDDYINSDGTLKDQFSMLIEVPFGEDFYTSTNSGIDVVIKSPDVEGNDNLFANEVKAYAKKLFDEMYTALKNNTDNLSNLIDVDSFAKAYLIQELGKNWDTHSWYLTYVPDENGNYKFYAAPVWDFDNSIGNARGVQSDLNGFGVKDYTQYTGWWCKYKKGSNNLSYLCTQNSQIMDAARNVWFKNFVPAVNAFAESGNTKTEILSSDVYYSFLNNAAEMNYKIWEMEADNDWICDHSSLTKATFDYSSLTYTEDKSATTYDQFTFKGQFDYMTDWFTSRAAWISNEWKADYTEGEDVPLTPVIPTNDPSVQPEIPKNAISAFVFNSTGKTEGDKLEEYGTKEGYKATFGNGTLVGSVNSDGYRALEWSAAEYGTGTEIVPIMPAGKKNPWGDNPYVQINLSTLGYENIAISLTSAGSKKCPATWQLAYSYDGENFTDIKDATYTIALGDRKNPIVYFDNLMLPAEVSDKENVTFRLYAVSNVTVSGGTTADDPTGGEFVINNIIITGDNIGGATMLLGDADSDGKISVKDATAIQKVVAKYSVSDFSEIAADVDENGKVNVRDATEIQKFCAHLEVNSEIGKNIAL